MKHKCKNCKHSMYIEKFAGQMMTDDGVEPIKYSVLKCTINPPTIEGFPSINMEWGCSLWGEPNA